MNKLLKTLVGRLLVFFGGLILILGIAGLFSGVAGSLLIALLFSGIGFSMVAAGVIIRL